MNLAIDLGRTIISRENNHAPFPDAFRVVNELVRLFHNTYIISRVNSEQKNRAEIWLEDNDFYNITGIPKDNVYYCFDRRDKAVIARGLRINVIIDDRPDVLIPMDESVKKILFNPYQGDLDKHGAKLKEIKNLIIVKNWREIEELLDKGMI